MSPLEVVHVVLSLDCGGLERIVLSLVTQGVTRGQRVGVVCLERPGTLAGQVEARGGWLACVHKPPGVRLTTIASLSRVFSEFRPAIIHTHQIGALVYAGPASRWASGAHVVHTEHGKHYEGRGRQRQLGRCAGWFAERFFCVSQDIAEGVLAHRIAPPRKVVVVPNGIEIARLGRRDEAVVAALRKTLGIPSAAPVIGTIGRLSDVKRQDFLLNAFAQVRTRIPGAHLVIVGDGPLMPALRSLASDLGLEEACHLVGYQAEPANHLHLMDVFALTSRSEGMPLVVLEAWSAGVPVVASRVGGLPELVRDGTDGLLFDSGDLAGLTAALEQLIRRPALARLLGEEGRRAAITLYDESRMARNYEEQYVSVITKHM